MAIYEHMVHQPDHKRDQQHLRILVTAKDIPGGLAAARSLHKWVPKFANSRFTRFGRVAALLVIAVLFHTYPLAPSNSDYSEAKARVNFGNPQRPMLVGGCQLGSELGSLT
jgi:hypothetical protein